MPHYQFPTNYVYWTEVENYEQINKEILPIMYGIKDKIKVCDPFPNCKMFSTVSLLHENVNNFLSDEVIRDIVWNPINKMMEEINSTYNYKILPNKSVIIEYWFNIYDKGDFQEMHEHITLPQTINGEEYHPSFSLIYIANDANEKSSTVFCEPKQYYRPFEKANGNVNFDTGLVKEIKTGTVLIFPSSLYHLVKPSKFPGRVTLAFNVFSTY